jgi:hypothetical protein
MVPLPNVMVRQKLPHVAQSGAFVDQMQITVHVTNVLITGQQIKEVKCESLFKSARFLLQELRYKYFSR